MALYGASRLAGVHADLVRLVYDVGSSHDIQVVAGARSLADEQKAIASGHSALRDPTSSLHVIVPGLRPLALAVDIAPWPVNWQDLPGFQALGAYMKERAAALEIGIRWGGDWTTLKDYDHFELATSGQCKA